jgi:hypothetical protein
MRSDLHLPLPDVPLVASRASKTVCFPIFTVSHAVRLPTAVPAVCRHALWPQCAYVQTVVLSSTSQAYVYSAEAEVVIVTTVWYDKITTLVQWMNAVEETNTRSQKYKHLM